MNLKVLAGTIALCALAVPPLSGKDKLEIINEQIRQIEAKMEEIKGQKSSLLNEIYKIELQLENTQIQINRLDLLMGEAQDKLARKKREEAELEKRISRSRESLKIILRVMYKIGATGAIKFFIHIANFDQLFHNYRLLTGLIRLKMEEVNQIKADLQKLASVKEELARETEKLTKLMAAKESQRRSLQALKTGKIGFIEKINADRASYFRMLDELKREAEALNRIIEKGEAVVAEPPIRFQQMKGRLSWPINGQVVSAFGRVKSSRFNTFTVNNGVEIRPAGGDSIRAVHAGEIVFSEYFRGYGNLLIIQHGRNFHTLYGHCETFIKVKGDRVAEGEVIAQVGSSGSLHGRSLYFEIRENLKPEDPLQWLRKR